MITDYEAVVADLRIYLVGKRSFGQRELIIKLTELEAKHRVEEGLPEKALRMYGNEIHEAITQPPASESAEREPAVVRG